MKDLTTIKVLWRQPDTLALWGIPYEMRADVGQSPNDLWKVQGQNGIRPHAQTWIYLGSPGWWDYTPRDEQEQIQAWLDEHSAWIPQGPCEWTRLADEGEA